jgi:hypothetical protein
MTTYGRTRPQPGHDHLEQTPTVNNEELARRYNGGEELTDLAQAARMSVGGLQQRLRRIGVPPRRKIDRATTLDAQVLADALQAQGSVSAAARSLGVGRAAFTSAAQRHGLLPRPEVPPDLASRYTGGASVAQLARDYATSTSVIVGWLQAADIPRRPRGRKPRDD